jgi:hypothetical protein
MYNDRMTVRRHYIEIADVPTSTEANVALAEELIDRYVGPQQKFIQSETSGRISAIDGAVIFDTNDQTSLNITSNYYSFCVLEMISGAAAGKREVIKTSDQDGKSVTLWAALSTAPAAGDYFKIYQLAKFPRIDDWDIPAGSNTYYKSIPELVREATVAQTLFIMSKPAAYFTGNSTDMKSEKFLNYQYERSAGAAEGSLNALISPQARSLLRGILNRKGRMTVGGL